MDATPPRPPIRHICVRRDHYLIGRDRPDGSGHLTFVDREWAYCAAALATEEHIWFRTAGVPLAELRHDIDWLAHRPDG